MGHHSKHKSKHKHSSHYHKGQKAPKSEDVEAFLITVTRAFYRREMPKIEAKVDEYLGRHHIKGTNAERYWRLKGICILMGREAGYSKPKEK